MDNQVQANRSSSHPVTADVSAQAGQNPALTGIIATSFRGEGSHRPCFDI